MFFEEFNLVGEVGEIIVESVYEFLYFENGICLLSDLNKVGV